MLLTGGGTKHFCGNCSRLNKRLKDSYHKYGRELENRLDAKASCHFQHLHIQDVAATEIDIRLKYEFVFGLISAEDMTGQNWLNPSLRDKGHTKRMEKLWVIMNN